VDRAEKIRIASDPRDARPEGLQDAGDRSGVGDPVVFQLMKRWMASLA
jgi:hypothetical protein